MYQPKIAWAVIACCCAICQLGWTDDTAEINPNYEAAFLTGVRQITFEGRRAGESYFSADGRQMVFQSEREPGNPFYQIYLMDMDTGDVERISTGIGKTTCAWIHPTAKQVLFASTQDDPEARHKQQAELDFRASGKDRRYSWDYDENYDLFVYDRPSQGYKNLTKTTGYDAEGSWSPDGKSIVFASNRAAYDQQLSPEMQATRKRDPSFFIDVYIMRSDGTHVRQLTHTQGYDGGPFFSPDGARICWRRFSENGALAEIMTMNVDGTDERQLTRLGAMSWAPFYHPSGDYLIFTTNRHGFGNFELYLVDAQGKSQPVRVTSTDGFDGLPVFTPDGQQLAWTSNRTANKQSQILMARWNDSHARKSLGLGPATPAATADRAKEVIAPATAAASAAVTRTTSDFSPQDILRHVDYLCRPELGGRLTGTPGELMATAYVAAYMHGLGLEPAGDRTKANHGANGSDGAKWYQPFEFTAGVSLGKGNALAAGSKHYVVDKDWRPMAFSRLGPIEPAGVVFAGYGIVAPAADGQAEYDSYVHLDVKHKWVVVLRFMPEDISAERRQQFSAHSSLRYKAMVARDKGAHGLIVVSGPTAKVNDELVRLQMDGSLAGASIPLISVTNQVAMEWFAKSKKDLSNLQQQLDTGEPMMGFELPGITLGGHVSIEQIKRRGRNVLGVLRVADKPTKQQIIVGAHVDHLGRGGGGSSLAREDEANQIHAGADDNASGVAAMLEIAQYLTSLQRNGALGAKRDVVFAAWSGEELGLLGSANYAQQRAATAGHGQAHAQGSAGPASFEHGETTGERGGRYTEQVSKNNANKPGGVHSPGSLYPEIAACLNLDMVGRLDKKLILQGIGSSSVWTAEIERRNVPVGLPITLQSDSYLPTDASTFFMRGVPILSAFTGSHGEYHTPRDTPDRLNYDGAAQIARLMALITRSLARRDAAPDYVPQVGPEKRTRARLRAYLGTIPDYAETDIKGVKLSGAAKGGPAAQGGARAGDIVVELAGKTIENIYDYTYAIEALKIGQEVTLTVRRADKLVKLKVTPGSRE